MSSYFFNSENMPDFSPLIETIRGIKEKMKPIADVVLKFEEITRPLRIIAESVQVRVKEMADALSEAMRPLYVAEKLGEVQYVYWNYMTNEFMNAIIESKNVNKTLREFMIQDRFKVVDDTIEKCRVNSYMNCYTRMFDQSVTAFKNGQSDLAVIGFTSIIDGLLTDISGNHTTRIATRACAIMDKFEQNETVDSDEYALVILMLTFQKTMESFSANSNFEKKEPKGLNRHWIMHGRSKRRKTKLDCVKLINFIYGILLIDEFGRKQEKENEV